MPAETLPELVDRVSRALSDLGRRTRVLSEIAWDRAVEAEFFAKRARELPVVTYNVDHDALRDRAVQFEALAQSIEGSDEPVRTYLRATARSFAAANLLLDSLGTLDFYRRSRDLYGGAKTRFVGSNLRNIDLAEHLSARLATHGYDGAHPRDHDDDPATMDAETFAQWFRDRAERRSPALKIRVEVDPDLSARMIAGRTRVRVRSDATFSEWEAEGLWAHEVETHALTAQNGALQSRLPFLASGGPRSTRTQEGLATFAEIDARRLSPSRMERLALRVKLVAMAEDGADFLVLYRYLLEQGNTEREAYLDAQRICRGGKVTGGAPFTKDACYLAGLLDVYAFLKAFARGGHRDELELILAGRCALEDLHALVILRTEGLLDAPRFLPPWLHNWRGLLPYFAFVSFAQELNLEVIEARYSAVISLAGSQRQSYPPPPLSVPDRASDGEV
ncbi:MAG: flavohemoglobin expression-modulating QEGLA motif protein [Deltaproteobacteria bacterium]|nr:flavohemoglobin expression-modulating QEGLA motif protein [Deltaproteobacteria bacterium]